MTGVRLRQLAYYLAAPAFCLALFWRAPFIWFRNDDFAWLSLRAQVHDLSSLGYVLFHPAAQGTVRVLGDRLFFLTLTSLFGLHAGPFRLVTLATWFAALALAAAIGTRITGSRAAGMIAALLWTANYSLVIPLTWASGFDQILCGCLVLAALYSRVRWLDSGDAKWRNLEWIAYLLGFGALEVVVMYPAVAVLYTWTVARRPVLERKYRGVFALFVPAVIYAAVDFLFIPKNPGAVYHIIVDHRLPATALKYVALSLGPASTLGRNGLAIGLAAFVIWRLWRRDWAALFCVGWFALFLAPVLPLPDHITGYYLSIPLVGLSWLGGWAVVSAWRVSTARLAGSSMSSSAAAKWLARGASVLLVAAFLRGSVRDINAETAWFLRRTSRMRFLVRGVQAAAAAHPGTALVFEGVDNELFQTGFEDNPFLLAGIEHAYLAPGTETVVQARADLGGIKRFRISNEQCLRLIESNQARVLEVTTAGPLRDVTSSFEVIMRAEYLATHRNFVDVGNPLYASRLGSTWYPMENGFRWMPRVASVQLGGPSSLSEHLYVTGYGAAPALASGPVELRFRADGQELGRATVRQPNQKFAFNFPLPAKLIGQYAIEVTIEAGKTFRPAGDSRELGMIFGTFAIH
jgi:hypothetical protein